MLAAPLKQCSSSSADICVCDPGAERILVFGRTHVLRLPQHGHSTRFVDRKCTRKIAPAMWRKAVQNIKKDVSFLSEASAQDSAQTEAAAPTAAQLDDNVPQASFSAKAELIRCTI